MSASCGMRTPLSADALLYRMMTTDRQAADGVDRYLVSTICRGSRPGEPSGRLYVVDREHGVQSACPIPPPEHLHREPNPRGGIRGGRGLAAAGDGDSVYVANGAQVLRFDRWWRTQQAINHPWCGNVHDIAVHDDRLWVCSTANDALAAFDPAGRLSDLIDLRPAGALDRDGSRFASAVDYRDPAGYELANANRLHANGIGFDAGGAPLVALGRVEPAGTGAPGRGLIARADGGGGPLTVSADAAVPIHNVVPESDGTVLTLDTGAGTLCVLRPDGTVAATVALAPPAPYGFLRGLCPTADGRLLVGERNRLLIVDLEEARLAGQLTLSGSLSEAVYAIAPLPHAFEPLPAALTP